MSRSSREAMNPFSNRFSHEAIRSFHRMGADGILRWGHTLREKGKYKWLSQS